MTATIHNFFEWPYRARITVTSPSSSATYTSTVSITFLKGMKSDFSDLRFFNLKGEKLSYWIRSDNIVASTSCEVRIKGAVDREVIILFGNPEAESESDIDAAMTWGDDFPGDSLNTAKWTKSASMTATVSGGVCALSSAANDHNILGKTAVSRPCVFEARCTLTSTPSNSLYIWGLSSSDAKNSVTIHNRYDEDTLLQRNKAAGTNSENRNGTKDTSYHLWKIIWTDSAVSYYRDGVLLGTISTNIPSVALAPIHHLNDGDTANVDYCFIREYAATEPTLTFHTNVVINPYYLGALGIPAEILLACGSFFGAVEKSVQGKYSILLEKALTGKYDIMTYIPVEKSIQGKYSLLLEKGITGKYSLQLEKTLQAKYSILLEKALTGKYTIFHRRTLEIPYDILVKKTLQLLYDIDCGIYLDYVVLIEDTAFTEVFDLTASGKVSQTAIASFSLVPTSEEESYLDPGNEIHILFNDSTIFSGEIKKAVKDDVSGIWTVECAGLANQVQDLKVETAVEHRSITRQNLIEPLLPAGWELDLDGADRYTSYVLEHKDHLEHIVQLARDFGLEWLAVQEEITRRIVAIGANTLTLDMPITAGRYAGYYLYILSGTAKYAGALVTGNTTSVVTTTGLDWAASGVQAGDLVLLYGPKQLQMIEQVGSPTSVVTLKIGRDIYDCKRTRDLDKVKNRLIVPGQTSGLQKTVAVCDAAVVTPAELAFSEPYLAANLSATETESMEILGASPRAFINVGVAGKVRIDDEIIAYTNAWEDYPPGESPGAIVGLTRGVDGTTPAAHNIYASVLVHGYLPLTGDGAADLPSSGAVWIGGEKIAYTLKVTEPALGTYIKGLTRGVSGSPAYGHRAGTWVRDAAYSPSSPETGSSIQLYGLREDLVPADALNDRADLDIQAQNYLSVAKDLHTFGKAMLGMADFTTPVSLGDVITIEEMESSTQTDYRVFGLEFDQMAGSIAIQFGTVQEELLETLKDIKTAKTLATSRRPPGRLGTIAEVSSNSEMVLVNLDDGSTGWARTE